MKKLISIYLLVVIAICSFSDDRTINLDGRTVVLHDDFTWEYVESNTKTDSRKMKLYYDPSSTIPYRSKNEKYILHLSDHEWNQISGLNPQSQFEFENNDSSGWGMVIYEGLTYPLDFLKEAMINNVQDLDPNARIIETEKCIVNNTMGEIVTYTARSSGLDFIFFSYITTSDSGTVQFTFFTLESAFDSLKPSFLEAISGFEFIL